LVDAGVGEREHVDAVAAALGGTSLASVLVTHAHVDHASGAATLSRRWPSATLRKLPWPEMDGRYPVEWRPIRDGERLRAGDGDLTALHTPGHAPDHLCFWHEPSRTLFCGDLLVQGSTVVLPASNGGDLADYLESLRRINALAPAVAYSAHGSTIHDPVTLIDEYLQHRGQREEQVLNALARGLSTPDALVDDIYTDLHAELKGAARESVLAHLVKLEREGRVLRHRDGWRLT
jgi:glyoxylase-like metal-dependent hydrolase (beta-lactamase superfamily II)